MPCRVWRACSGVRGVMFAQCAVVAAVRDVVRACSAYVCMLRASVRCAVRGLLRALFLGDTRHDADVSLWWLGLVVSCVCRRVCVLCDGSGERGASRHVRVGPVGPSKMRRVVAASFARLYCRMRVLGVHCRRCVERSE